MATPRRRMRASAAAPATGGSESGTTSWRPPLRRATSIGRIPACVARAAAVAGSPAGSRRIVMRPAQRAHPRLQRQTLGRTPHVKACAARNQATRCTIWAYGARGTHDGGRRRPEFYVEQDVMSSTTDKIKGSVKKTVGKATGDKEMETKGEAEKIKGHVKDAAHEAKESVKRASRE